MAEWKPWLDPEFKSSFTLDPDFKPSLTSDGKYLVQPSELDPDFNMVGDGEYPAIPPDYRDDNGIPVPKISKKARLWMIVRRFGKCAFWGGAATFATTRDLTLTGIVALIGGIGAGTDKLIKETRKVAGKPSMMDIIKRWLVLIQDTIKFIRNNKGGGK